MSCAKSNSYNVEEYEAEREQSLDKGGCEDDEPLETADSPDNSEKGTSLPSYCRIPYIGYWKCSFNGLKWTMEPLENLKSHCLLFYSELKELLFVLVLLVASGMAVSHATSTLFLHWDSESNAEQTGRPRPSYWYFQLNCMYHKLWSFFILGGMCVDFYS